ncbi:MAG: PorT family protein [Paludibacteraceae bacterium]|nr:PorT family protein [Paludibacteraceae bacterium]
MKRIFLIILSIVCVYAYVYAQSGSKQSQPDLQQAGGDIFDLTKEQPEEPYQFKVDYRLEVGYVQWQHRSVNETFPMGYLYGGRIGVTFDFTLPKHFMLQTGVLYTLSYGTREQHWGQMGAEDMYGRENYIKHRLLENQLTIPVRAYYHIPLVKDFGLFFYAGPQFQVGLALNDLLNNKLTPMTEQWLIDNGYNVEKYDRYKADEIQRCNIQMGLGGGFEWKRCRIQAGYDFGLNNLVKRKICADQQMWEWGYYVSFSYLLK